MTAGKSASPLYSNHFAESRPLDREATVHRATVILSAAKDLSRGMLLHEILRCAQAKLSQIF
jgi:hypothetical protein